MFNKLGKLSATVENLKKQVQEAAKNEVRPALAEVATVLAEKIPQLTHIKWTQYAPHFNDGDACIFSINEPEFGFLDAELAAQLAEAEGDEPSEDPLYFNVHTDYESKKLELYSYEVDDDLAPKLTAEQLKLLETISDNIMGLESVMQEAFGDDAEVIFNLKTGEITNEYADHD